MSDWLEGLLIMLGYVAYWLALVGVFELGMWLHFRGKK